MTRTALAFLALAALSACATLPQRDLVWIGVSGDEPCLVALDDRRFALPADAARLDTLARRLARRSAGALIGEVDGATSFTCWSRAIAALSGVGFRRLGLVTGRADPE